MSNEKMDSTLNVSLEAEQNQRIKSDILSSGYDEESNTWEVIVKYHGDIEKISGMVQETDILINDYAIVRATKGQLEELALWEQIEYLELPKGLQFDIYRAKQESCILPLIAGENGLNGKGVLIAVIDSGIDYLLQDFRDAQGSRILYLWDQTLEQAGTTGNQKTLGIEFTKTDIDKAIAIATAKDGIRDYRAAQEIVPSTDASGHGTAVAGIAAGSSLSPLYRGVAPKSSLIVVKLRGQRQNSPLSTDLMRAITYVVQKAEELEKAVAINISIGDTYGAHDGTSLLERFIDSVCQNGRNVICIGAGNEAVANGHTSFIPETVMRVELSVSERERGTNVQIWKNYVDTCKIILEAPNGERYEVDLERVGLQEWINANTQVLIYVAPPRPFSVNEQIFFDFIPIEDYVESGIWTFIMEPVTPFQHDYHMFLPGAAVRNSGTRFLQANPELTMTIPAFARRALTIGAYDGALDAYADFSGRNRRLSQEERVFFAIETKPDIVAPGVGIRAPVAGGGYASFTGTSFATPIVTGSVALMMEWGIARGNDMFLYGEKVKAYLRKGARALNGDSLYPNEKTGWGALCLEDSLPE